MRATTVEEQQDAAGGLDGEEPGGGAGEAPGQEAVGSQPRMAPRVVIAQFIVCHRNSHDECLCR